MTIDQRIEALQVNIESLHLNLSELFASVSKIHATTVHDGEHIRALVRVAEIHEHPLSDLEGNSDTR